MVNDYKIAIIGAGVTGCAIARELCRYDVSVVILEKDYDVSNGTSKANSGIVHSGYDAKEGTLKAKFNVLGNGKFDSVCKQLDVAFKKIGSITIATNAEEVAMLGELLNRGLKNGVSQLQMLNRDKLNELEPNLSDDVVAGLYAPTAGVVDPFGLTIALAENAIDNGVDIELNSEVLAIEKKSAGYKIETSGRNITADYVINCAGLYADKISQMVCGDKFKITPRRGEYVLFDKTVGNLVNHVIFQCPSAKGKGVLVSPTAHGNLLVGPNSEEIDCKDNTATTSLALEGICKTALKSVKNIPMRMAIANFSGLRATADRGDFIIAQSAEGFINVAGIESPGLTASLAIAEYVPQLLKIAGLDLQQSDNFNPIRRPVIKFAELNDAQKEKIVKQDSRYGNIVCRCENITEGEIVDAIHRNAGARSVDGVKKRVRAGMGRCQGGFCAPRVMEILARELKKDYGQICKSNQNSRIVLSRTKGGSNE